MDTAILGEILKGGADKVMEAGAVLAGGHTIQDDTIFNAVFGSPPIA